ncbi:hypothetical protein K353_00540 [Kitasatospora sp. SolWspMP-SS2h]|nr:hypothetical protein K353_00540 [Kitasatospora sp. SolWspMP-SS2h]
MRCRMPVPRRAPAVAGPSHAARAGLPRAVRPALSEPSETPGRASA